MGSRHALEAQLQRVPGRATRSQLLALLHPDRQCFRAAVERCACGGRSCGHTERSCEAWTQAGQAVRRRIGEGAPTGVDRSGGSCTPADSGGVRRVGEPQSGLERKEASDTADGGEVSRRLGRRADRTRPSRAPSGRGCRETQARRQLARRLGDCRRHGLGARDPAQAASRQTRLRRMRRVAPLDDCAAVRRGTRWPGDERVGHPPCCSHRPACRRRSPHHGPQREGHQGQGR